MHHDNLVLVHCLSCLNLDNNVRLRITSLISGLAKLLHRGSSTVAQCMRPAHVDGYSVVTDGLTGEPCLALG